MNCKKPTCATTADFGRGSESESRALPPRSDFHRCGRAPT